MIRSPLLYKALLVVLATVIAATWLSSSATNLKESLFNIDLLAQHQFGTGDFIEYWSSHYLIDQGKNPYSPSLQLEIQQSIGRNTSTPLMMWNPPWTVLLMKPILIWPYFKSAQLFLWTNLFLTLLAVGFSVAAIKQNASTVPKYSFIPAALFSMLYLPWWNALQLGQIALILAAAAWGFYYCISRRHYYSAGLLFSVLSLKPHLFIVLGVAVLVWSVQKRSFQVICGVLVGIVLFVSSACFFAPDSLTQWIHVSLNPSDIQGVERVYNWRVATFSDFLKDFFPEQISTQPLFAFLIALASSIGVAGWLIRKRNALDWSTDFPWILTLSLVSAPVAWVSDQAILLPLVAILALSIWSHPSGLQMSIGLALLALLSASFWYKFCCAQFHHQLWWIPLGLLIIWGVYAKSLHLKKP